MMKSKYCYIYIITNIITGKIYIGQRTCAKNPENDNYLGSGVKLLKSKNKHGINNFKKEIVEICNENDLNEREKFWIKKFDSINPEIGYNLVEGGRYGVKGIKNLVPWNKGVPMTYEQKLVQRNIKLGVPRDDLKGLKRSEESKFRMSESAKNRKSEGRLGCKMSEHSKKLISEKKKGVKLSEETKLRMSLSRKGREVPWLKGKKFPKKQEIETNYLLELSIH